MSISKKQYRTITHERMAGFESLVINAKDSDIIIAKSEDDTCRVVVCERKNAPHVVKRTDEKLSIDICDNRKWYQRIFSFKKEGEIKIFLPKNQYNALSINLASGYVEVPSEISFANAEINIQSGVANLGTTVSGEMKLDIKSGDISIHQAKIGELNASVEKGNIILSESKIFGALNTNVDSGSTQFNDISASKADMSIENGPINMTGFVVEESLHINGKNSNVTFDGCDADELFVNISKGKVAGNLLSDKMFITNIKLGRTNVPSSIDGGRCQIGIGIGSIDLKIK